MKSLPLLRLSALLASAGSLWVLLANLLQTWDTFDPSYARHYLQQHLTRPLVGLFLAGLLLMFARPLARWLDRD